MKSLSVFTIFAALVFSVTLHSREITGRFAPPEGKVLVFVGQDNQSIGGSANYRDGYVENVGIPGGISHYLILSPGWTNEIGYKFSGESFDGLHSEADWGNGPMHLKAYLDSPMLDRCPIHLSISIPGESERGLANGDLDPLIDELVAFVAEHPDHPFFVRIGHELGVPGFRYDADSFRKAFRRIVEGLRRDRLANVAIVYSSSTEVKAGQLEEYDPGSEYYDWIGYSWWGGQNDGRYALEFARKVEKPAMISEATPLGYYFDRANQGDVWNHWFEEFFTHIEQNTDVVRAFSYINADWDSRELWEGWGMTRIESSPSIMQRWRDKMNSPMYVNSVDKPFSVIGFPAPYEEPEAIPVEPYAVYRDVAASVPDRVSDLLARMTLEEKISQLTGWWDRDEQTIRREGAIFDREFYSQIAPEGVGVIGSINLSIEEDIRQYHALNEYFINRTRLGIPAMRNVAATHGLTRLEATSFPAPIALSCSWNRDLVKRVYQHVGREARSRGYRIVRGPNLSLARDPRWGQIDETLGEDPFLVGRLAGSMVEGLEQLGVAAMLAHFAGSGNPVGGRHGSPYAGGKRDLLEKEVEPFRFVMAGSGLTAVIPGTNEIDGIPCHMNKWLMIDVLQQQLGFDGLVVSEDRAIRLIHEKKKIGESLVDVAARALTNGIHLDLPNGDSFRSLSQLIERDELEIEQLDMAVSQVLETKFRLGLFEPDRLSFNHAFELTEAEDTSQLALESARQSIVLLKNDGILPLDPDRTQKIAVIGPNSDVCRLGSRSGTPRRTVSLLDGIKQRLGNQAEVLHAKGCMIALNDTHDSYLNWRHVNEVNFVSPKSNQVLIDEAVAVAEYADLVILALGENELLGRETRDSNHLGDRASVTLTDSQRLLAKSVLATGKPVILYLNHGRPIGLGDLNDQCKAVLTGYYTGQESGTAAAEIIFGDSNPSGKLTVSWPDSAGQLPANYNRHNRAINVAYNDTSSEAVYPFGYGLSYTTFEYSQPSLSKQSLSPGNSIDVTFEVSNSGTRAGTEITQLYVSGEKFEVVRPAQELKGFVRVTLQPGETRMVSISLKADDLHFYNEKLERVLPKGIYQVRVGGSSRELSEPVQLKVGPEELEDSMTSKPEESNRQPNILFVSIDDLRPELGIYGANIKSPNIDLLASTGVRFNRAYCQQAVCGASRLSVMGGLYPETIGEQSAQVERWRERHPDLLTLNQHFGGSGYETIGMGKVYYGTSGESADVENWDRWINVYGPEYASLESIEALKAAVELRGGIDKNVNGPTTEMVDVADDTYVDGKRALKAVEVLKELASLNREKPFFFALGFSRPHLPFVAPEKYWNLYQRDDFKMPFNRTIPPGYPIFATNPGADEMQTYSDFEGSKPSEFSGAFNRRLLHGYAASVSYVDACFGQVMDTLEQTGLADNTIVILWSDHGWKLGDHSTWSKHTNFECDTRVPLIVRDPRVEGGLVSSRMVELVDLYPTLCDLAGIEVPSHCQGRSFRHLLTRPDSGHRWEAYSSYPTQNGGMGYSIRYKQYRYSEWYDEGGAMTHRVLTDLEDDPGEVTNLVEDLDYIDDLVDVSARLKDRIRMAAPIPKAVESPRMTVSDPESKGVSSVSAEIDISPRNLRQSIDGFGGSIAFWGTRADEEALKAAINGLNANIVRAQGEVSPEGDPEHNRDILERVMQINPRIEVLLTFWQPKSVDNPETSYWLNEIEEDGSYYYELKPEREMAWAIEIAMRVRQYREWGINVQTIGVQNEANWSHPGTQTCRWEPDRLADFIERKVQPALNAAGLSDIKIAAPDLAFIGDGASEVDRFIPVLTSRLVDVAAYHMYDSFNSGMKDTSISRLSRNSQIMSNIRNQYFPEKRLWMTETTGAQWNSEEWHTYGWKESLTEHEKAIKAARYIHTALVDAEASAFLWWGLVYSVAPERETDQNVITKHRDEGLVLVEEKQTNGRQAFLERTAKYYTFRQYSGFVKRDYRRVHMVSPDDLQLSAFLSPDEKLLVCIAVNDTANSTLLEMRAPEGMRVIGAIQTDETKKCSPVDAKSPIPSKAVRTIIFSR